MQMHVLTLTVPAHCTSAPLCGPALPFSEGSVNTGMASFAAGAQGDGFGLPERCGGLYLRKRWGAVENR